MISPDADKPSGLILHVAPKGRFIEGARRVFDESRAGVSDWLLYSDDPAASPVGFPPSASVPSGYLGTAAFADSLKGYRAVVFHSLPSVRIRIPKSVPTAWIGWGFDYYDLIVPNESDLLDPKTLALFSLQREKAARARRNDRLRHRFLHRVRAFRAPRWKRGFVAGTSFFSPVLEVEHDLIKTRNPWFAASYIDWNYGTLEDDFAFDGIDAPPHPRGNDILIGNSASHTNNHLDVFHRLTRIDLSRRKVIAPLSYGDREYAQAVEAAGRECFGGAFLPLTEYMDRAKYIRLIASCSVVIMNHKRQQGLGNIITTMYSGARVFLRRANPVYGFLKAAGAVVFDIEELNEDPTLTERPLARRDVEINRAVLRARWSRTVIREKTRGFIQRITSRESG